MLRTASTIVVLIVFGLIGTASAQMIDLTKAVIVVRPGDVPAAEKIAPKILSEELYRRTAVPFKVIDEWPTATTAVIAISTLADPPAWKTHQDSTLSSVPDKAEAFSIGVSPASGGRPAIVAVTGYDARGAMYGVGKLLRSLNWKRGEVSISADFKAKAAPDRPIRGHQIGYRDTANSWDAWTFSQFDQYFREMAIFGANAVENIPWQDDKPGPLMKYSREEMNLKFAELADKYDLDHWIWVPVLIKLPDEAKEIEVLKRQEDYFSKIKRLDAIFVPGGDPGDNTAESLLPHLERMASILTKHHSKAKIWLSLQHFKPDDIDFLYQYLDQKRPNWFGGLVMGPSSPPMELTRQRLARPYQLRWYPDITHSVRCQYPIPWLDPALGMTLGREPVNPRPVDYTQIYRKEYTFTEGFITYSDGAHDDFNKCLWLQLGWDPDTNAREVAKDYARFYFRPDLAESGADGLFALESDTRGSLEENGSVSATLTLWKELEERLKSEIRKNPDKTGSDVETQSRQAFDNLRAGAEPWRFRMHLFRAYYVDFTRRRLIYEKQLEHQALNVLGQARENGVVRTLAAANQVLDRAVHEPFDQKTIDKLNQFGEELFQEIGLQTSVPKYQASNSQRGAILDFIDYPLNNRWWLEDQFEKILKMSDSMAQFERIEVIRNWENPGDRGYYDVLGHVGRSPRVVKLLLAGDSMRHDEDLPIPTQRWMRETKSVNRQAWHSYLDSFPQGITYNDLDTDGQYVIRLFSQRESPLVIDGVKAKLIKTGETFDKVTEQIFEVPGEASRDGKITLTWETLDEKHLNWRDRHYVTDVWVMKRPPNLSSSN